VIVVRDGQRYEGNWKNGKMNGVGEYTWPNGDHYIGEYLNDLKHGKGVLKKVNGEVYDGAWKEGKQDGLGESTDEYGVVRIGKWANGIVLKWLAE